MSVSTGTLHEQSFICSSHSTTRHVILPQQLAKHVPTDRLMSEREWRELGVTQSPGWMHYMIHGPEPHILLFKRPKEMGGQVSTCTVDINGA